MNTTFNLTPALPEIFMLIMVCVSLLLGLFLNKYRHITYYLAQFTLILTALLSWYTYSQFDLSNTVYTFHHSFVLDKFTVVLKTAIYLSAFMSFWYARVYNDNRHLPQNEFYVLGLLSVLGMMVLVSAHSLLILYLGVELLSLPIYAMIALQRGKARCLEAAMKYFIIGGVASAILLYGLSMIFGVTHALDLTAISEHIKTLSTANQVLLVFGLIFTLAGIAFKLGIAPFHMWVPDVYDGAPTSVTLFLSAAPKLAAFALMIHLLVDAMPALHVQWSHVLVVFALFSMAIGNIVAIIQTNIKRMLAYSSIAHMGYMLLGVLCVTSRGYAAALFYIISYALMTLGGFGLLALMSPAEGELTEINHLVGLNSRNPWLAFMLLVLMFSMAGVPPLVGFIAKVGIFEALIQVHQTWLAVVALLFAIVGAYYYLRVVKVMYFQEPTETTPVHCPKDNIVAISINGLMIILLGIFPGALFSLCHLVF
ncbi:MAG: NADH-quinone oxidoreductase subunit NuoN [Gammaproteobacteria bacterium]|nr:NADH-quinone oxidoreductase subunit NuoN [Gammaproteobacteria bacterium]